jgi:beta-xylosidase
MTRSPVNPSPTTVWRDPTANADARLDALIAEMTIAEKVAQPGSVWLGFDAVTGEVAPMQNAFSRNLAWPAVAADATTRQ